MKTWVKILLYILGILACIAIGFFTGRKTSEGKTITKIEYVTLEPIHDTIDHPVPYKVVDVVDTCDIIKQCIIDGKYAELFPTKTITDTITKIDTTTIMIDWAKTRYYNDVLFDIDSLGKCTYEAIVQYNEMKMLGYTYVPVQKQVETKEVQVRTFSPFVGAGISFNPSVEIELGAFYQEKWGASISGRYNIKHQSDDFLSKYDIGLKIIRKF